MSERRALGEGLVLTDVSVMASVILVSLIVVSGIAYACSTGPPQPSPNLVVTSIGKTSGPSYAIFTEKSPPPTSAAVFEVGPFAPGDTVVVSYTVENIGNLPASLSTPGVAVAPTGSGFSATEGPIPSSLGVGASFSSTISITFKAGLKDSYEGSTAVITLQISGTGTTTTSTCTSTVTHTATSTYTVITTKTVTSTKTVTTTTTTTKLLGPQPDASPLWVSTTSCTTITVSITSTTTVTQTTTVTVTKTTTVTKTVTTTSSSKH